MAFCGLRLDATASRVGQMMAAQKGGYASVPLDILEGLIAFARYGGLNPSTAAELHAEYHNVSKEQAVEAADAIAGWLPGWVRHEQQKLVVAAFEAAGFTIEEWENVAQGVGTTGTPTPANAVVTSGGSEGAATAAKYSTSATDEAEERLRSIVYIYRSWRRSHTHAAFQHYRDALEECIEEVEKWLNAKQ